MQQDARVAEAVRGQAARLERLGGLKQSNDDTVVTAVTVFAVPVDTARKAASSGTGVKRIKTSLQDPVYVDDGAYSVTMITSQPEDTDFEFTPFVGTVHRTAPDGSSDVWAATLNHGTQQLTDLGSPQQLLP